MLKRARWRNLIWVAPAVLILAVFVYLPLASNVGFSFLEWNIYSGESTWVGGANYERMVDDPVFWRSLGNNVLYAGASLVFQVFGGLCLAALVESLRSERTKKALRAIYFAPAAISVTVAGLLFYFIYEPHFGFLNKALDGLGLTFLTHAWLGDPDTAMGAIIAMSQWQTFGYTSLLFAIAIQRIPSELGDAAAIDGLGAVRRFWYITIPLVREMTTLLVIVTVSGAFQVFNEVMVMTSGGPDNATQVLVTWLYRNAFSSNNLGYASAIAIVIFAVTLSLAVAQLAVNRRRKVEW
jgi:raffinose/stachyose/melibiose transport system permease protein